jgi:Outer membrane protein beta-barrel domain
MKKLKIYHEKYRKMGLVIICLVFCVVSTPCYSQSFFSKLFNSDGTRRKSMYEKHSDISFGIGTSNYYGDLAPYNRPIKSTLQNINWNIGVDFTRHFSPHFSGRASLTWVRLTGDDNKFEGVAGLEQLYMRNAHFRNDVQELALTGVYNFIPESRSFRNRAKVNPYVFAGIAVFHHDPMAKVPTDYAGSEASPGEWVSLQPLNTEGQGLPNYPDQPYNLVNVNIPFGAGVKYKLNKEWDLGFEVGVRYTFSDYLDDVGGYFADKGDLTGISSLSAAMGHRENEKIAAWTGRDREAFARAYYVTRVDPAFSDPSLYPIGSFPELDGTIGGVRNSSSRLNDMYILTSFKIIYHIAPSIKCPVIR